MREHGWFSHALGLLAGAPSARFVRFTRAQLRGDLGDEMSEEMRQSCHASADDTATDLSMPALRKVEHANFMTQ